MRKSIIAGVAAGLVVLTATSASADSRVSFGKVCNFAGWWVNDPVVRTQWNDYGTPYWSPSAVLVTCQGIGCVEIDSVLASTFDAMTDTYRGGAYWKLPAKWRQGRLSIPSSYPIDVQKGHRMMTVVTLKRSNGNYCTVVNDRLIPEG